MLTFGAYRIVRRIADGASGAVVEAVHTATNRPVALKLPNPTRVAEGTDHIHQCFATLFAQEARLLGRIDHPQVVTIYDAGIIGACPYIAMSLLTGGDLAEDIRRRGPWSETEVLRLLATMAEGVGAIHAAGILHRDLKPANIMLNARRLPVIIDFGIAMDMAQVITAQPDVIDGTPNYLAPEIVGGAAPSHASDIYGMGAIAWFALTGAPPIANASIQAILTTLALMTDTTHLPPLPQSCSPGVNELLHRLLSPMPQHRVSAAAVTVACQRLLAGERSAFPRQKSKRHTTSHDGTLQPA